MAEEQAGDVTRQATRDADRLLEQTQTELDRQRESANAELDELRQTAAAASWTPCVARPSGTPTRWRYDTRTESEQLLASARVEAEAVKNESERPPGPGWRRPASRPSQLVAAAERDAAGSASRPRSSATGR